MHDKPEQEQPRSGDTIAEASAEQPPKPKRKWGRVLVAVGALIAVCAMAAAVRLFVLDEIYVARGNDYYEQDNLETALTNYNRAIELDPQNAKAYNGRGNVYYDQGDLETALADYDRAIELDPQYTIAYYNRGLAHRKLGDLEAALADFDRAIEIDPEYARAYYGRGLAYDDLGNAEAAIADYEQFLALHTVEDESSAYARKRIEELRGQ